MSPHAAVLALMLALLAVPATAGSKAADYLVRETIAQACGSGTGTIDPSAVIERDLTGDGKADLVISEEGITCSDGGRSLNCGAALCLLSIYVRRGALLELEHEMLGAGVTVNGGPIPAIHTYSQNGTPGTVKWTGQGFR